MHELSIARALMDLADRYLPPEGRVQSLQVRVGPLQALEENSMHWAWLAATADTRYEGAALDLEYVPPRRRCRECGAESDGEAFEPCPRCESPFTMPVGGDELLLVSVDVEDSVAPGAADKRGRSADRRNAGPNHKEILDARPGRRECTEAE